MWRTSWVGAHLRNAVKTLLLMQAGHVIGFDHEHQRPDRDKYIDFHCEALSEHPDAEANVRDPVKSAITFVKDATFERDMERV